MSRKNDIKKQIEINNRYLNELKEQAAKFGIYVPVHISIEIQDKEAEIEKLEKELANLVEHVNKTDTNLFGKKYRILKKLGEGGFATVFLAEDITLFNRKVALKVLKLELSENDPAFLKRFEREAQTAAHLSHPNIIDIYEFGQENGRYFIVMPHLTGSDLAHRIRQQGVLESTQVIRIAEQVGAALDYAHHKGIIHRDIKPSNVLFNEQDNAILTDFGIVKLVDETVAMTQPEGVIGTPVYMAPEQCNMGSVDARTDLYAFGVMTYEMLTGRVPFVSETPLQVMFAHVKETPPSPHTLNPNLPLTTEKVLLKMLAKSPTERYENAGQFCADLQTALMGYLEVDVVKENQPDLSDPATLLSPVPSVMPSPIPASSEVAPPSISVKANKPKQPANRGWIISIIGLIIITIFGGIYSSNPKNSNSFLVVSIWGTPTPIPPLSGRIVFTSGITQTDIYIMNADTTNRVNLTNSSFDEIDPAWSPDGKKIAFISDRDAGITAFTDIYLMNADGTNPIRLTTDSPGKNTSPTWSPDGKKIAFVSDRDAGGIVAFTDIYLMNADGTNPINLTNSVGFNWDPAWSPDGKKIAFASHRSNNSEIYVMNADGTNPINVTTSEESIDSYPAWSPDGEKIAFVSKRGSNSEIYVMNADGTNPIELPRTYPGDRGRPAWSPDGKRIIVIINWLDQVSGIYVINADDGTTIDHLTDFGTGTYQDFDWIP